MGGIKEKVLGAHRAQMTKVILPWGNRKDVEHDVARVCEDGEGGFRCCVWQEQVGVEEGCCVVGECEAIVGGVFLIFSTAFFPFVAWLYWLYILNSY